MIIGFFHPTQGTFRALPYILILNSQCYAYFDIDFLLFMKNMHKLIAYLETRESYFFKDTKHDMFRTIKRFCLEGFRTKKLLSGNLPDNTKLSLTGNY